MPTTTTIEAVLPSLKPTRDISSIATCRLRPKCLVLTFIPVLLFVAFLSSRHLTTLKDFIPISPHHSQLTPAQRTILQYAKWHQNQRRCLTDSSCTNPPLLIWQCPENNAMRCAGVGDRFRGLAFSLMLAIATKRVLLVDWDPFPYPLQHAIIPASFNWTIPNSLKSNSFPVLNWFHCVPVRPCYKSGFSPLITNLPPLNTTEPDFNLEKDDLNTRLSNYPYITIWNRISLSALIHFQQNPHLVSLLPAIQHTPSNELHKTLFQFLFNPSPTVASLTSRAPLKRSEIYDGLHVRTGADVGETSSERFQKINRNINNTVAQLLSCVIKKRPGSKRRVFLASDSSIFKSLFQERAKQHGIEVLYLEQPAMHIGLSKKAIQNMTEPERRSQYLSVFVDLVLLSRADTIMSTGSGFANTAFCLGKASRLIILRENCS